MSIVQVSNNRWYTAKSRLIARALHACGIIRVKSNPMERRLMIIGGYGSGYGNYRPEVEYLRLSDMTMHWGNNLPYGHEWARFVNTDQFRGFLVGGYFTWHGQHVL